MTIATWPRRRDSGAGLQGGLPRQPRTQNYLSPGTVLTDIIAGTDFQQQLLPGSYFGAPDAAAAPAGTTHVLGG